MRKGIMVLLGVTMMTLFTACSHTQSSKEGLWQVHFEYDCYSGSQFYLDAWVERITEAGAEVTVRKRIGPNNSTGIQKEGTFQINAGQLQELRDILSRYDLEAFSRLPTRSSGASPRRTLRVWDGESDTEIPWNAVFPKTTPPQEDILYYELFQFFNGLLKNEPEWQEVAGEDLEDPRQDPRYTVRMVEQFGNMVALVPGTGNSTDGHGAQLDYGSQDWWRAEGFTGSWKTVTTDRFETTGETGTLIVQEDGSVSLTLNEVLYSGMLGTVRTYREPIQVRLEQEGESRLFELYPLNQDDYSELQIQSYPGPVPEPQFDPVDVCMTKE